MGRADHLVGFAHDLYAIPYSEEYRQFLTKAAELLRKAGDLTSTPRYKFVVSFIYVLVEFFDLFIYLFIF